MIDPTDRNARITDALRPGSRRCTEPCPDCKSSSVLNSRTQTYVPHSGDSEPCPTCTDGVVSMHEPPLEQLKSLLPLWKDSKSSYADDQFLGAAVRRTDLPAIIAWAEGTQQQLAGAEEKICSLRRKLDEANERVMQLEHDLGIR